MTWNVFKICAFHIQNCKTNKIGCCTFNFQFVVHALSVKVLPGAQQVGTV